MYTLTAVVDPQRSFDRALFTRLHAAVFDEHLPARVGVVFVTQQGQHALSRAPRAFEPFSAAETTAADVTGDASAAVLVVRAFEFARKKVCSRHSSNSEGGRKEGMR